MGNKTFVSLLVFISPVCVHIRVKPIITARIVTICWAVSQSVYDGIELNAAVVTSMVRAVWVSFSCFDFVSMLGFDKGTSFTMYSICSVLLSVVLRLHDIVARFALCNLSVLSKLCILTVLARKHSCLNVL